MPGTRIAFYPYSSYGTDYIVTMQRLLQTKYDVVDYLQVKYGLWDIEDVDCIYLNWLEDYLDEYDRVFLKKAVSLGVKTIWVFHNKKTHDSCDHGVAMGNIAFLADICDRVVIHSKNSGNILASICNVSFDTIKDKLTYIPHPNYIGDYKSYKYPNKTIEYAELPNKVFTYAFIGLMRPYKNVELLIKAYKMIRETINSRLIMAGRFIGNDYYETIRGMCDGCSDVIFRPYYVGSLEMERILYMADVMVLPFNNESSMNSGSMLMAFSYGKTVIVPDICMAEDFPDDLIFRYHYENVEQHVESLKNMMMRAYECGTEEVLRKGNALYKIVSQYYSKEIVKNKLINLCMSDR